jgi:hypothetical protein
LAHTHEQLQRLAPVAMYLPELRAQSQTGEPIATLFTLPRQHNDAALTVQPQTLADYAKRDYVSLPKLRRNLVSILRMLNAWSGLVRRNDHFGTNVALSKWLPNITNPPVLPNATLLAFDLEDIPVLPNPLLLIDSKSPTRNWTIEPVLHLGHGALTADRVIVTDAPVVLDWSTAHYTPFPFLDHLRLELDLLLRLVPPSDAQIWRREWPALAKAFRSLALVSDEVDGQLAPLALAAVSPIRETISKQLHTEPFVPFWLSAIRAGLDVVADPSQIGPNRLAAMLYAAIALDTAKEALGIEAASVSSNPATWPGFLAWRSTPLRETFSGYALLVGSGTFPLDGTIPQIPQAKADLAELASLLSQRGYEVHLLMDDDFTVAQFEAKIQALERLPLLRAVPLIVCFCGHGLLAGDQYYLLTGDSTMANIESKAILAERWVSALGTLRPARKLIMINSCYSSQMLYAAHQFTSPEQEQTAVMVSAARDEQSYSLRDDPYSLFMGTTLEALSLTDQPATPTRLFSFLSYVAQEVPLRAAKIGKSQHPQFHLNRVTENFALL